MPGKSLSRIPPFLNYGDNPPTPMCVQLRRSTDAIQLSAEERAKEITAHVEKAKLCMRIAQDRQRAQTNKGRQDHEFKEGDLVMLNAKNLRFKGIRKFMPRFVGPFAIEKAVGKVAFKLLLRDDWKGIHPVFHVGMLKPFKEGAEGLVTVDSVGIGNEGCPLFRVTAIEGHKWIQLEKRSKPQVRLLVRWACTEEMTWEPLTNLITCSDLMEQYKKGWEKDGNLWTADNITPAAKAFMTAENRNARKRKLSAVQRSDERGKKNGPLRWKEDVEDNHSDGKQFRKAAMARGHWEG